MYIITKENSSKKRNEILTKTALFAPAWRIYIFTTHPAFPRTRSGFSIILYLNRTSSPNPLICILRSVTQKEAAYQHYTLASVYRNLNMWSRWLAFNELLQPQNKPLIR